MALAENHSSSKQCFMTILDPGHCGREKWGGALHPRRRSLPVPKPSHIPVTYDALPQAGSMPSQLSCMEANDDFVTSQEMK